MKLQHLAIGARFEYEGEIFVKTGPLTAASEVGGQKMIPRYAVLRPVEAAAVARQSPSAQERAQIKAAFADFCAALSPWLVADDGAAEAALVEARQAFLARIDALYQ